MFQMLQRLHRPQKELEVSQRQMAEPQKELEGPTNEIGDFRGQGMELKK